MPPFLGLLIINGCVAVGLLYLLFRDLGGDD